MLGDGDGDDDDIAGPPRDRGRALSSVHFPCLLTSFELDFRSPLPVDFTRLAVFFAFEFVFCRNIESMIGSIESMIESVIESMISLPI